jgi:restriction system protein
MAEQGNTLKTAFGYRNDLIRESVRTDQRKARQARRAKIDGLIGKTTSFSKLQEAADYLFKELKTILEQGITAPKKLDFDSLRLSGTFHSFEPPPELITPRALPSHAPPLTTTEWDWLEMDVKLNTRKPPAKEPFFLGIKPPTFLERIFRSSRHANELRAAESAFQNALKIYEASCEALELKELKIHEALESVRKTKLEELSATYEKEKQTFLKTVSQRNKYVDDFKFAYFDLEPDAIVEYNTLILERSDYPTGFPQKFRLAYIPESKQLVIDYELPPLTVVPEAAEYRYVKSRNVSEPKLLKPKEIKEIYQDVVAAITLRTIHEIISADQNNSVEVIVFNGFVQTIDRATGKKIQPYLVSVRATKGMFSELDLSQVEKRACLRNLGAQVSPQPSEMIAVKPIVEFDMVDKRFVEQTDVLGSLDARPNLMELDPFEFENLVHNLFSKMGLETKLTRSSRDGGVDVVAFDKRPIIGGKVVVQAKRYKNTVGVSAVRDLFGTMINEGANKGILVTTSSYGPDAYEFAKDKPIELIDGGGLLYLLEQVGIKARIIFPEDANPF